MCPAGSLPPQYAAWIQLTYFGVQSNLLTGSLPPGYSSWTSLTFFSVAFNQISGTGLSSGGSGV